MIDTLIAGVNLKITMLGVKKPTQKNITHTPFMLNSRICKQIYSDQR